MKLIVLIFMSLIINLSASEIVIRPVTPDDWQEFRNLRLKALAEEPLAYGISVEDEVDYPDDYWKELCGKWFFVAQHEGKLIGMLGATELHGRYMRHQVEICSAFVEKSFRQQGILTKLFYGLKRELQKIPHLEQMIVWVTLHENQTSKYAFEKFGFKYAGVLSNTVKYEGKYYDCCWLEALLK